MSAEHRESDGTRVGPPRNIPDTHAPQKTDKPHNEQPHKTTTGRNAAQTVLYTKGVEPRLALGTESRHHTLVS